MIYNMNCCSDQNGVQEKPEMVMLDIENSCNMTLHGRGVHLDQDCDEKIHFANYSLLSTIKQVVQSVKLADPYERRM